MVGLETILSVLLRWMGLDGVTQQGKGKAWALNTGLGAKDAGQHPPSADVQSAWPGNPRQPAGDGEEDYRETDFLPACPLGSRDR